MRPCPASAACSSADGWLELTLPAGGKRERAELFPTPEDYVAQCPVPISAYGFSKLTGEVYCRAAHAEHGLPYTICPDVRC